MTLRMLNLIVIGALVLAAAYVYRIKYDSTVQAERLAKIRGEVRHVRDAIAALRARWGELDNPARIEALAKHHLPLKPIVPTQFNSFDQLPERPPQLIPPGSPDPIGAVIEKLEEPGPITGSISPPGIAPAPPAAANDDASAAESPAAESERLDR
jgi:hypothetical protein